MVVEGLAEVEEVDRSARLGGDGPRRGGRSESSREPKFSSAGGSTIRATVAQRSARAAG